MYSDWSRGFWNITQELGFSLICNIYGNYRKISTFIFKSKNDNKLSKPPKPSLLGHFWDFLRPRDLARLFLNILPHCSCFMTIQLHVKSQKKTDEPILKSCMDERTDRTSFIGHFN